MLGCSLSKLDGTEKKVTKNLTNNVPRCYSFQNVLSPVTNQGSTNTCVAHGLACFLNWVTDMKQKTSKKDNKISIVDIYNSREDKKHDNGMSIKEALEYAKHHGVKSGIGTLKINDYAMIGSWLIAKQAILANGPVIISIPVYDSSRNDFWNGTEKEGYHCIALIGYNDEGFIIRNSWGTSYGKNGYWILPYKDFSKVRECWTMI